MASDFIPYKKAFEILKEKLQATPEELAAWVFWGPERGGIAAYLNANELNSPPRFYFANYSAWEDYLVPFMRCWFQREDIDRFEPAEHYITGTALIERWGKDPALRPEAFIRAKIAESRLVDMHPTFGQTEAAWGENCGHLPPLSAGLFAMSHIERIEAEDGLVLTNFEVEPDQNAPRAMDDIEGRLLEGDKEIANYANRSVTTIRRWRKEDKSWWWRGPTGKPMTTTLELDKWRSRKKNDDAK